MASAELKPKGDITKGAWQLHFGPVDKVTIGSAHKSNWSWVASEHRLLWPDHAFQGTAVADVTVPTKPDKGCYVFWLLALKHSITISKNLLRIPISSIRTSISDSAVLEKYSCVSFACWWNLTSNFLIISWKSTEGKCRSGTVVAQSHYMFLSLILPK